MVTEVKPEKIGGYDIHPLASMFPLLDGGEFDAFVDSVRQRGLKKKIIIDTEGRIADGRNRLRACLKLGIAPQFVQLTEKDDVVSVILDENIHRRNLDTSQRAMYAAKLTSNMVGRPKKGAEAVSIMDAAKKFDVSRSAVVNARAIQADGITELQESVFSGEVKVTPAAAIAALPVEQQAAAVAQVRSGENRPRTRTSDATFNYEKWARKAEVQYSKMLAEVPPDLNDRARGTFRDITGGSLRREAKIDTADDEDVEMFDAEDIIARTDRMLKEVPVAERKGIRQAIGAHYIGDKPEQYMPGFSDDDADTAILSVLVAELRYRLSVLESYPAEQKAMKKLISDLRKLTKADDAAE